jgi:creatinine amidohydrolase
VATVKRGVLLEMTSAELRDAVAGGALVIVPVASTEVLGHHGPLGADVFVADEVSRRLAERVGGVAAPTIPVGEASDMMPWPGTLTVRPDVLTNYYLDVCRSLAHHGFRRMIFLTAHLGNLAPVATCARAMRRHGVLVAQVDWWRAAARAGADLLTTERQPTGHGGELISSVLLALRPDLVQLSAARDTEPAPGLARHLPYTAISGGPFYTYPGFRDFTASGAWGDVTHASAEKGEAILDRAVASIAEFVESLHEDPLPEAERSGSLAP